MSGGIWWCLVVSRRKGGDFPNVLKCMGQRQDLFKELKKLFVVVVVVVGAFGL